MSQRQIVIGDVHGCIDELDELLRTVQFARGKDRLVFVGDLVDRGPDSIGVVRRARELEAECTLGNHEEKFLRFRLREREVREGKRKKNEVQFTDDKRATYAQLNEEDWAYFEAMPLLIHLGDYVAVVHAGFEPGALVCNQDPGKVIRLVYVGVDGLMAKHHEDFRRRPEGAKRWAETFHECSVVYGHAVFSLEKPTIDCVEDRTHYGIDTGCYAGGRLSAWIREPGRLPTVAQIQAKQVYRSRYLSQE